MAKTNSTQPIEKQPVRAAHQRFDWINGAVQSFPGASFASITMDIAGGMQTVLEIIEKTELDRVQNIDEEPGEETPPTLNVTDAARLLRLSIATNNLLYQHAEKHIDWINNHGENFLRERGFTGNLAKSPYA